MSENIIKKTWTIRSKRADFNDLSRKYGIDPVIARILVNRDVPESEIPSFLKPTRGDFNNPHTMQDMDLCVEKICAAILEDKRFRIIGDYDIDGICATYILLQSLKSLGARVDYYLPKRIEDGYGMNEAMVENAARDGVEVLITCDNGISAGPAVSLAKRMGITVLVTDHHEVPRDSLGNDILPPADVVVDPKRADCAYPFKEICGAVVVWKLCMCLMEKMRGSVEEIMEYIEFAAMATIGDIMLLKDENRAIVTLGLKRMSRTRNIGLRMLITCCELDGKKLNAHDIGYVIGPCLNAGGRLADASLGVELFLCKDDAKARDIAMTLKSLNEERKSMTGEGMAQAVQSIEENGYENDNIIVAYVPGVHESLCGIIAGRLKEKYSRPCFMLSDGESYVKGSGRSTESYSMFDHLRQCEDLFLMYGGHPMAAGLSIERDNIEIFRRTINENSGLTKEDMTDKVMIDVAMPLWYLSFELMDQLNILEPFGNGNEKPVFAQKDVYIVRTQRIEGRNGAFLKLVLKSGERTIEGLYFGDPDEFLSQADSGDNIDIIYYPQVKEFRGEWTLKVVVKDYRKSGGKL